MSIWSPTRSYTCIEFHGQQNVKFWYSIVTITTVLQRFISLKTVFFGFYFDHRFHAATMLFQTRFPNFWLSTAIIKFSAMYSLVSVALAIMKHEHSPCLSGDGWKLKRPNIFSSHTNANAWVLFGNLHMIHKTDTIHTNIGLRHVHVTIVAVEK